MFLVQPESTLVKGPLKTLGKNEVVVGWCILGTVKDLEFMLIFVFSFLGSLDICTEWCEVLQLPVKFIPLPLFYSPSMDLAQISHWGFPGGSAVENPPVVQEMQEMRVWSLGQEEPLRRTWQPTPVFLSGESHRQRSLVGYSPWGSQKVGPDWSNWAHTHANIHYSTSVVRYPFRSYLLFICTELKCTNSTFLSLKLMPPLRLHCMLWVNSSSGEPFVPV